MADLTTQVIRLHTYRPMNDDMTADVVMCHAKVSLCTHMMLYPPWSALELLNHYYHFPLQGHRLVMLVEETLELCLLSLHAVNITTLSAENCGFKNTVTCSPMENSL